MTEQIMVLLHGLAILLFGVFLSVCLAGVPLTKKNIWVSLGFCLLLAAVQGVLLSFFGETTVWMLYPFITHIPVVLFLIFYSKKRVITALVSVFSTYLFCQPAKWFGVLALSLTDSTVVEYIVRIVILLLVFVLLLLFLARTFAEIFEKDTKSVCVFAIIPMIYYVFDYLTVVYTSAWLDNNRVAAEFLPFFMCIMFTVFSIVYYKEYEKSSDAERKEQIIRITVEEQAKELDAIRRSEREIKMLRHDLRLILGTLAVCVENDDKDTARDLINTYTEQVERTKMQRFCSNDAVNYVLTDFEAKCEVHGIKFVHTIGVDYITVDEIMFSSILSNVLDNAIHAVTQLPPGKRSVSLMIKAANGKLLFSVKNPINQKPVFVDGLPVSGKAGHGYGTQSIRYLTEKMGGNCQFTANDEFFWVRVII